MKRFLQSILITLALAQSVFAMTILNTDGPEKVHLVVFGDSWSDNGNKCKATNEKVWNEYITEINPAYQVHNYAGCGDKSTALNTEIDKFLKQSPVTNNDTVVYVIWIGGNDYMGIPDTLQSTAINAEDPLSFFWGANSQVDKISRETVKRIHAAADRLLNEAPGKFKYVLIGNLPNFSLFPAGSPIKLFLQKSTGLDAILGNALDALSVTHNIRVSYFINAYCPEQKVRLLNFYYFFDDVISNPSKHGITNLEFECNTPEKCNSELFHDAIHFGHRGHFLIARYVDERIKNISNASENLSDVHNTVGADALTKEGLEVYNLGAEYTKKQIEAAKEFYNKHLKDDLQEGLKQAGEFFGLY